MIRAIENPIITKSHIKPTSEHLKVDGVFNCGATIYQDRYVLLLRIAESAKSKPGFIDVPLINEDGELIIKSLDKNNNDYVFHDSRTISNKHKKVEYLTSLSHFRRAFSNDGIHFKIDEKPWIFPYGKMESWGIEDPRITLIDDEYHIIYTAVSSYGVTCGHIVTKDFESYERKGIILPVDNKDASLFPEKINNQYVLYHRPIPSDIGYPNMWIAKSHDLVHWGEHEVLLSVGKDGWDSGRIGGGAPSIKTPYGWLHIYHAASKGKPVYALGAFLSDINHPEIITHKTEQPILKPEEVYEREGFFGDVVFTCGAILKDDQLMIYYGAADDKIGLATITLHELYQQLKPYRG